MVSLVNWDTLAARYAEELHAEGMSIHDPVSPAAVLMDLARLAGMPVPSVAAEADHPHVYNFDMPATFSECVTCGATPF